MAAATAAATVSAETPPRPETRLAPFNNSNRSIIGPDSAAGLSEGILPDLERGVETRTDFSMGHFDPLPMSGIRHAKSTRANVMRSSPPQAGRSRIDVHLRPPPSRRALSGRISRLLAQRGVSGVSTFAPGDGSEPHLRDGALAARAGGTRCRALRRSGLESAAVA